MRFPPGRERGAVARQLLALRVILEFVAFAFALNGPTPFITPNQPWLSMLPLVLAMSFALLIFGLRYRAQR